jgi:hypothetical protein
LVDVSLYNNIIYNDLLKYLHLNLDIYGAKLSDIALSMNINLYAIDDIKNNDTNILNDLLKAYNKVSFFKKNRRKFFANERLIGKVKREYHFTDETALPAISTDNVTTALRDAS